jgi:hypothetical protein
MATSRKDMAGLVALGICTILTLALVPGASLMRPVTPPDQAIYGFLLTLVALGLFRALGRVRSERIWLAVLLALMPVVYIRSGLAQDPPANLTIELVGLALFVGLAIGGILQSPWLLVLGLLAHGLAWDIWHLDGAVVPRWYALACVAVDIGLAAYAATRVAVWQNSDAPARAAA